MSEFAAFAVSRSPRLRRQELVQDSGMGVLVYDVDGFQSSL